jgi:hypothetical protein
MTFQALHEHLSTQTSQMSSLEVGLGVAQATISTLLSDMAFFRDASLPTRVSSLESAMPSALASMESSLRAELQGGALSAGLSALQSTVTSSSSSVEVALRSLFSGDLTARLQHLEQSVLAASSVLEDNVRPSLSTLQSSVSSLEGVPQTVAALSSRLEDLANAGNVTALALQLTSLKGDVSKVLPFVLLRTNTAGRYDIGDIFDKARNDGLTAHLYECVLMTDNGAHWKGRAFMVIANHYTDSTHPGYPHRIMDVVDLDAGSSGCSQGLTNFVVTGDTGYFDFNPGSCIQTVTLACRPPLF